MKYKLVIILLLTSLIILLSGVTYSVFTSDASLKVEEQDIAKFIFEAEQTDQIHLPINELKPGDNTSYDFSVTNRKEGKIKIEIKTKNERGITLVALVITIIVIIILSTVTISTVFRRQRNNKESTRSKKYGSK